MQEHTIIKICHRHGKLTGNEVTPKPRYGYIGSYICKHCQRESKKKYKTKNREKIREIDKIYRENNKESIKERLRKYRESNRGKLSKRMYYEKNKESIIARTAIYQKKNKGKKQKSCSRYYYKNRERILEFYRNKVSEMDDSYIRYLIESSGILKIDKVPKEFIETYKDLLTLKREIKKCQSKM